MIGVGDVVVCVDADCGSHQGERRSGILVEGKCYTVARIVPSEQYKGDCAGGVVLVGLRCNGLGFCIGRFRKVQPKSASKHIDRLKRIPSRQREDA